jgi:hypothetical protein
MPLNLAEIFYQRAATQPEHPVILGPHEQTRITYSSMVHQPIMS